MKKRGEYHGKPALDLVEEGVHLLRQAPPRLLLAYYVGTVPFVLGLLFFWANMSVGAYAARQCAPAALGMALLFVWMKCWQAGFAGGLRERFAGLSPEKWNWRRVVRVLVVQGTLQPFKLFLLPVALVSLVPFIWVLAFFENATVLGDGRETGVRPALREAWRQAWIWPWQNLFLVLLLLLAGLVVWLNAFILLASGPYLLKMLLGIESAFTRAGIWSVFNSTFLAATMALAYLVVDPLVKALYVLRCFYGQARYDGADLLAELAALRPVAGKALALAVVLFLAFRPVTAVAEDATTAPPPARTATADRVSPQDLDHAVQETLKHDKYSWRMPREKEAASPEEAGWLATHLQKFGEWIGAGLKAIGKFISKVLRWIDELFTPRSRNTPSGGSNANWMPILRGFAYLLLALAVAALGVLLYRVWRQGGWRAPQLVRAEVLAAPPDLTDENITASQLPEDGWLQLARELAGRGELRLALRALYLAGLAHLAARDFLSIARFKSNRDYQRELSRRARGNATLLGAFAENMGTFERVWYGPHEITPAGLQQFQGNLERIRAC